MSSTTSTIDNDALRFTHTREQDGKVSVTLHVGAAGQTFSRSVYLQESEQRGALLNEICAEFPGIDREWARGEILKLSRMTRIDLRWDVSRKINGTAPASARLWRGKEVIETVSLNLFDPKKRESAIRYLAPFVAGRNAAKKKIEAAMRELAKLFREKLQEVATAPAQQAQARMGFDPDRPEKIPYEILDGVGIIWRKPLMGGGELQQRLSNWTARIIANVVRSDGVNRTRELEIEAALTGKSAHRFTINAEDFKDLKWAIMELGGEAWIEAEEGTERRVKVAIQKLSTPTQKLVYTHTGWVQRDGTWQYLHAGGAITPTGNVAVDVALDGPLSKYLFPEPPSGPGLTACIRASLKMLQLGPAEVMFPPYCAIWRALLGRSEYTVSLVGPSGAFKSEIAALDAQHFGAEMSRLNLAANWNGTYNALIEFAYLAKDALLPIDEFKLHGNSTDEKQKRKADDVIQGIGNGAGKARMKANGGLWADRPPRASLLSTGEQVPGTKSCIARQLVTEVPPGAIESSRLTECQNDAARGLYVGAAAAYVQWQAQDDRIERTRSQLKELVPQLRARAAASALHRRTPGIVADLYAGLLFFLEFAAEKQAITSIEQKQIQDAAWQALGRVAERQRDWLESTDPALRYLELLESSISSGEAHLAGADGDHPGEELATACGWWRETPGGTLWRRQGLLIGYVTHEGIALLPDATLKVIRRAAGNTAEGPVGNERDLRKRLHERGVLVVENDQKFQRLSVRRVLAGRLQSVLMLRHSALSLSGARNVRNEPVAEAPTSIFESPRGAKS